MEREPAVAGEFYKSDSGTLSSDIDGFLRNAKIARKDVENAISYVAPHAGYKYSGQIEAYTYNALLMSKRLKDTETFVIVGPNHTGIGYPISVSLSDWKTPLGLVKSDVKLSKEIAHSDNITIDESAHAQEHSIEVQLPFLQKVVKKPRCSFICMGDQSLEYCKTLSSAIIAGAKKIGRRITVIASSDFNHYESADVAKRKDMPAIECLKKLDFEGFHRCINELDDSACGYGPITVAGMVAKDEGARSGIMLKYSNSGEVTKDYKSVVAYSSVIFI